MVRARDMKDAPAPAGENEAALFVPCVRESLPDMLPEDWELPFRFVPAPPGMTFISPCLYRPVVPPPRTFDW